MSRTLRIVFAFALGLSSVRAGDFAWDLPPGFAPPEVPADNPMTAAKVELGRHLFHDRRLSGNRTQSCASCHRQELGFSDGRPRALGSTAKVHPRGAQALSNLAYRDGLTWLADGPATLEAQARVPMLGENPVEMGMKGRVSEVLDRLRAEPRYGPLFAAAFPGEDDPVTLENVIRALACFERTLISGRSAFDRALFDDELEALSPRAWKGLALFRSERLGCGGCHAGVDFLGPAAEGARLRTPGLRNIAVSAPYMHDGSLRDLNAVLDFYAGGKRKGLAPFRLDEADRAAVLEFLRSLTDEEYLRDPRFSDPWPRRF